jgi:hypothetical protein
MNGSLGVKMKFHGNSFFLQQHIESLMVEKATDFSDLNRTFASECCLRLGASAQICETLTQKSEPRLMQCESVVYERRPLLVEAEA